MTETSELVLIGGRCGVGKSSVALEMFSQLSSFGVSHALIEGDLLDLAYPPPREHMLAERNLAAMWSNYRDLGYRRLIHTNTASILFADPIVAALAGHVHVSSFLLTCSDDTARSRLLRREIGTALEEHLQRSREAAVRLDESASEGVVRIDTDGRGVDSIASEVIDCLNWS